MFADAQTPFWVLDTIRGYFSHSVFVLSLNIIRLPRSSRVRDFKNYIELQHQ